MPRSRRDHARGAALSDAGDRRAGVLALWHGAADDIDHPAADAGRDVGDPGRDRLGDDVQHSRDRGGDADDRLAGVPLRHQARGGLLDRLLHAGNAAVRDGAVARDAGVVAHPSGRRGCAGRAAVAVDPVRHVPAPPAHDGDVDLRDGGRGRAGVRSGDRRLSRRDATAGAGRSTCWCRSASAPPSACAGPCRRTAAGEGSLRLDRFPRARHRTCRRATRARARRAAGLVQFDGDRDRMPDRGARILHFHGAQPRVPARRS